MGRVCHVQLCCGWQVGEPQMHVIVSHDSVWVLDVVDDWQAVS